jgi:hypothetical protein
LDGKKKNKKQKKTKKKKKNKYSNPNGTDTSISTQHIDRIGFSCTISQENIPINKYSIILKKHNLKEQRKTKRIQWNKKRCAENAKISGEIHEKTHTT